MHAFCCWTWTQTQTLTRCFIWHAVRGVQRGSQEQVLLCAFRVLVVLFTFRAVLIFSIFFHEYSHLVAGTTVHEQAPSFPMLLVQPHADIFCLCLADVHV